MLREDQVQRYARHILLPDIGGVGQKRFLAAAVEVEVGPGCAAELAALAYLAAAGVGRLMLAGDALGAVTEAEARDGILLGPGDIGRPRLQAIAARISAINPDVLVERAGTSPAVPLAPVPARPAPGPVGLALHAEPADPSGIGPGIMTDTVASALIRGGAQAIQTLTRLARPSEAVEVP